MQKIYWQHKFYSTQNTKSLFLLILEFFKMVVRYQTVGHRVIEYDFVTKPMKDTFYTLFNLSFKN